jgi:hypothetical protein
MREEEKSGGNRLLPLCLIFSIETIFVSFNDQGKEEEHLNFLSLGDASFVDTDINHNKRQYIADTGV